MFLKVFILFLGIFFGGTKAVDIGYCSTTNIANTFNVSNYIRFQTPNYPSTMDKSSNLTCNSNFLAAVNGNYLWFSIINGAFMEASITDNASSSTPLFDYESNYEISTFTSKSGKINFQFLNEFTQNQIWTAFDSVVLSFPPSSAADCPFSGQTINMDNDTIIPISSDYGIFYNASNNCTWTFKNIDSTKYQFKIYIKLLTHYYNLVIKNDGITNGFGFNVTLYDPQVVYLNGSQLDLMLYNIRNQQNQNGFFAIISLVPIVANSFQSCGTFESDDGSVGITNVDPVNGYNAFSTCSLEIELKNGYEAVLDVSQFWIEAGVDKLTVSKGDQNWELKNAGFFKIKSDLNGAMLKFAADGNTHQAGFEAYYTPIKCECADSAFVIPCDGYSNLTPLPKSVDSYCDNQNCSYTITLDSSCSMDYYTISPYMDLRNTAWLAIYVNGNLFQNYTNYATPEVLPYPRNTNMSIVFQSGKSVTPFLIGNPTWWIQTMAVPSPITNKIMLNASLPAYSAWLDDMSADSAFTVCSPDNDLELFIAQGISMNNFDLYDSDQLTNFVAVLSSNTFPQTSPGSAISYVKSKSGCFTIYCSDKGGYVISPLLFRMQKTHTQNCNTAQNVVRLLQGVPASYTVDAKNSGSCEMIVFSEPYNLNPLLSLDDFQTSSNATFSFSSGLNRNPYFYLPSTEIDLWKQTTLYTSVLSVVAPASSSLTFNISTSESYINIDVGTAKRKGVVVSPLYSGTNLTMFMSSVIYTFNLNTPRLANFVVKDLSPTANVTLQNFLTNETHIFVANENYTTNASTFYISTVQNGNNPFRIEYGFDVMVNDTETTTVMSTSTTVISPTTSPTATAPTTSPTATAPTTSPTVTSPTTSPTATAPTTSPTTTVTTTTTATTTSVSSTTTTTNDGFVSSYHFLTLLVSFILAFFRFGNN